jgi:hypothetical protein
MLARTIMLANAIVVVEGILNEKDDTGWNILNLQIKRE